MTALNRGIAQRITSLEMNQRELKDSLVTAWAAFQQNETALSALKKAVRESLVGKEQSEQKAEQPNIISADSTEQPAIRNPLNRAVSGNNLL